jgi:hypothetical protein
MRNGEMLINFTFFWREASKNGSLTITSNTIRSDNSSAFFSFTVRDISNSNVKMLLSHTEDENIKRAIEHGIEMIRQEEQESQRQKQLQEELFN